MMTRPRLLSILAVLGSLSAPIRAEAYTINTAISGDCHEQITMLALRNARAASLLAAPLPLVTGDDSAMAQDLPYTPDSDMQDLGAIALVLGMRYSDLHGVSAQDLDAVNTVQADPTTQDEHCLRTDGDTEPTGTAKAVARCRALILSKFTAALAHLDGSGRPSVSDRVDLDVSLPIRGRVTIPLPAFYVNMGQAMHALEDSFAHTYRTRDARQITASLNFLAVQRGNLNEAVDGPPHRVGLDACSGLDAERATKIGAAEVAVRELLLAALASGTNDARIARANAVLDAYLSYKPGCTFANKWCNAPEQAYAASLSCALRPGNGPRGDASGWAIVAILVAALGLTRGRARRVPGPAGIVLAGLVLLPREARAEDAPGPAPIETRPDPGTPWGVYVAGGAAVDKPALSAGGGLRLRVARSWLVGLDAEWNPFIAVSPLHARAGTFNAYATVIHRWLTREGRYDLRTSLHVGSSTALFALFGVPRGATGVYVGASPLGIEFRLPASLSFVLEPIEIAFPVPELGGTPFGYLQYRLTVGLQWGASS